MIFFVSGGSTLFLFLLFPFVCLSYVLRLLALLLKPSVLFLLLALSVKAQPGGAVHDSTLARIRVWRASTSPLVALPYVLLFCFTTLPYLPSPTAAAVSLCWAFYSLCPTYLIVIGRFSPLCLPVCT